MSEKHRQWELSAPCAPGGGRRHLIAWARISVRQVRRVGEDAAARSEQSRNTTAEASAWARSSSGDELFGLGYFIRRYFPRPAAESILPTAASSAAFAQYAVATSVFHCRRARLNEAGTMFMVTCPDCWNHSRSVRRTRCFIPSILHSRPSRRRAIRFRRGLLPTFISRVFRDAA